LFCARRKVGAKRVSLLRKTKRSLSATAVSLATAFLLPPFPPPHAWGGQRGGRGQIVGWTNRIWLLTQPTIQGINQIHGQARSHLTPQES